VALGRRDQPVQRVDDDFTGRNGDSGDLARILRLLLNDGVTGYALPTGAT